MSTRQVIILSSLPCTDPVFHYRCANLSYVLNAHSIISRAWAPAYVGIQQDHIEENIVILSRIRASEVPDSVQSLQRAKCVVGYTTDDLIFLQGNQLHPEYEPLMSMSSFFIVSTVQLAHVIHRYYPSKPIFIFPNYYPQIVQNALAAMKAVRAQQQNIVYTDGSNTHSKDITICEHAILHVMRKFPQATLRLMGNFLRETLERFQVLGDRVRHVGWVPFHMFPHLLNSVADCCIVALEDTPFNQCKSIVKLMEGAMVGAPAVYSNVGEYTALTLPGKVVSNSTEEWTGALSAMLTTLPSTSRLFKDTMQQTRGLQVGVATAKPIADYLKAL